MFLTTEDFQKVIKTDNLTQITTANPTILMDMAAVAVAEVASYLSGRHELDVPTAFSAQGASRNALLVLRCIDIATYHLYTQFSPRNIPDLRRDRYLESISWLKAINKGLNSIDLPLKEIVSGQTGYFLFSKGSGFNVR